ASRPWPPAMRSRGTISEESSSSWWTPRARSGAPSRCLPSTLESPPTCSVKRGGLPELSRRAPGSFGHARELRPYDVGINGGVPAPRAEPAARSGEDLLASAEPRVTADTLGDQIRMLDEVGSGVEHARDDHDVGRHLHALEDPPLVRVSRIRGLE